MQSSSGSCSHTAQLIWAASLPYCTGCCTGTTCQNIRPLSIVRGREYFHLFSGKNQKLNLAHKCPITSVQIRTQSQKLSEFSCNTFKPLNRGHPRFWPRTLKITQFSHGECVGRGGGGSRKHRASRPLIACGGGGGGEVRVTVLALNATWCM
jgi:hypothetical protein